MSEKIKEQSIGFALSGGGLRATIFSLGVLYYFIDRGLGERIRYVASVSGGSIANAYVAQECDLSSVTTDRFQEIIRRMSLKVAHEGLLGTPPVIGWIVGISAILLTGIAATVLADTVFLRMLALIITLFLIASALHLRGTAIGLALGWAFFRRGLHFTSLQDLSERTVRHVITATELSSGRPVFIESEWMHGPGMEFSYGRPGHLWLHRVVRWSCTVPALLPPGLIRTKTLSPERAIRGESANLPAWLSLVDGGVCNNLGTDYHDEDPPLSFGTRSEGFYNAPEADLEITVDSSGALANTNLKFACIPFLGELLTLPRNISILYQNTIIPRVESGKPIISIQLPPKMQQFAGGAKGTHGRERSERFRRGNEMGEYFREHFETHHEEKTIFDDVATSSCQVPTTFRALGEEATARLLLHGYLSAMSVCYSTFEIEPPEKICHRNIDHFRRLVAKEPQSISDPLQCTSPGCKPIRKIPGT